MSKGWHIQHIFSIPVGSEFGFDKDDMVFLVYSPLTGRSLLMTESESEEFESGLRQGNCKDEIRPLLGGSFPSQRPGYHASWHDYTTLYILLNQKCNFACSYCYSAKGRSNQELPREQLQSMLDFFFSPDSADSPRRKIVFLGGGEPLLSWSLLEFGVLYAEQQSVRSQKEVRFEIISNTSLFDDEKIDFLLKHHISVKSSFDILRHIQESQRGQYDIVAANLKKLLSAGISAGIQATITPQALPEMEKMICEVSVLFPQITGVTFEMVFSTDVFKDAKSVDDYMKLFYDGYSAARKTADKVGIRIFNSFLCMGDIVRDRYCGGLFVLTPEGRLSACPFVSSSADPGYQAMLIGKTQNGQLEIDEEKYSAFSNANAQHQEKCRDCFARWNCGGGCPNARRIYTPEIRESICINTRRYLKKELLRKICEDYYRNHNKSLEETLHRILK